MILDRTWAMYVTRRQVSALSLFGPQGHAGVTRPNTRSSRTGSGHLPGLSEEC